MSGSSGNIKTANTPDQSEYSRSLIASFVFRGDNLKHPVTRRADSECPDQTAQMRRLIWFFFVTVLTIDAFSRRMIQIQLCTACTHAPTFNLTLKALITTAAGKTTFCIQRKYDLTFHVNRMPGGRYTWNVVFFSENNNNKTGCRLLQLCFAL